MASQFGLVVGFTTIASCAPEQKIKKLALKDYYLSYIYIHNPVSTEFYAIVSFREIVHKVG